MKTLKTLKQALKLSQSQVNAQDLLRGSIYTAKGWEKFNKSEEFRNEVIAHILSNIGGHQKTKDKVKSVLKYSTVSHWALRRIFFDYRKDYNDKRKKVIRVSYCAGQDYVQELATLRKDILK